MSKFLTILIFLFFLKVNSQISDFKDIDFTVADNIAKLNHGESIKNLPLLTYKLTSKLSTDVEKFRAIFVWVCHNISNDYNAFRKINSNRKKYKNDPKAYAKWHYNYKKKVFNRLLKHKKTVCNGYAYLIQQMAFIAGLECKMIDGYGRNVTANLDELGLPNHTWNAIKLNNKWYLCDATWSSGYINENYTFLNHYNDGYFLTDPLLFSKNHQPLQQKWLLNIQQTDEDFVNSPLVYETTFEHKIIPILPENLYIETVKNKPLIFKLKTLNTIDVNKLKLIYYTSNNRERQLNIKNLKTNKNTISFKISFPKKGVYDIHLKLNEEIIVSYAVYVNDN